MSSNETFVEASKQTPCPLCGKTHYCYLGQSEQGEVVKAICGWTEQAPDEWERVGLAKDGRGIFTKRGYRRKRRNYPDYVQLEPVAKTDFPEWKDYLLDMSGDPVALRKQGKEQELAIEYFYPGEQGQKQGKVVRLQWTDRRRCYEDNRKTKSIRPWHWVGSVGEGFWTDRGKGDKPWPLYREQEAIEAILAGGIVFAVAGEQAVETYRELGLTATTCQGGEMNYQQFIERLQDAFTVALSSGLKPVLVIHPDNDITGESKFGEQLQHDCDFARIPAVVINPLALWAEMPPGGDIFDIVRSSGLARDAILQALETEIDEAIDRQELEIRARIQRARWRAPEVWQGELGYWRVDKETQERRFEPRTDFDFYVERELSSDDGGGLILQIKRADDRHQRRIFIKSTDYTSSQKFDDALKRAMGDGVICNLNTFEIKALFRVRLHEYHVTRRGKTYKLVDRVGQQADGIWVFKDQQFTGNGEPTEEAQSLWVWNSKLTGEESTLPAPKIAPQDPQAIKTLVDTMRRAFGSNFMPSLLALGYAAAGVHYQDILEAEGAFPTLNLYGDPGSGKTTAAECALALVGMHADGMMCDVSLSAAYERLKLSGSLLHCLDDPTRTPELNSFLKGFYNGKARVVRGKDVSFNVQRPHSPMMVTSNHACGENDAATQSRLVRLFFAKVGDGDRSAFYELPAAQRGASGGITQLMKIGYPAEKVHELEQELLTHLPNAHIRISKSLALLTCYALKVAELAEAPEDLKEYVISTVCASVNDPDEAGDSVRDFLEKLFVLEAQSRVGEWNMRWIEKASGKKVLAVHLPSVWQALDRDFSLAYNRKVIESLLEAQGIAKTRQRFHRSEDESKAYRRALLTSGEVITPNPPEEVTRFCYELPVDLLAEVSDKNGSTRSTSLPKQGENPTADNVDSLITLDQREINEGTERSTSGGEATLVDQIERSTNPSVDLQVINEPIADGDGNTAEKNTLVDLVDLKNTQLVESVEPGPTIAPISPQPVNKQQLSLPEVGDLVLVAAAATWYRSGSDKLTWSDVPKSYRDKAEIPLSVISGELFTDLIGISKVISISKDGKKIKVRQQEKGRTSVFGVEAVTVYRKGSEQ